MFDLVIRVFKFKPNYSIWVTILTLLTAFIEGIGITLVIPVVNMLKESDLTESSSLIKKFQYVIESLGFEYKIESVLLLMILLFSFKTVVAILAKFLITKISTDFSYELQRKLFSSLMTTKYVKLQKFKLGTLVAGIMNDPGSSAHALTIATSICANILLAFLYTLILLKISVTLTLITVLSALIFYFPLQFLNRYAVHVGRDRLAASDDIADRLVEMITKIKYYFSSRKLDVHKEKFELSLIGLRNALFRNAFTANLYGLLSQPITIILISIIIWLAKSNDIEFELLILFIVSLIRVPPLVFHTQALFVEINNLYPSFEKVQNLLNTFENNAQVKDDKKFNLPPAFTIRGHNLTYYIEDNKILDKIQFSISSGKMYFVVGESGSGKTTFLDIIMGLRKEYSGDLFIDEHELKNVSLSSWKNNISYVTQDPIVWSDTLKNNIIEYSDFNQSLFEKTLSQFGCKDFVENLPEKEETVISSSILNVSGGQRQRIAIARAFYSQSAIVLLDEVTSALDSETERDLVHSIRNSSIIDSKTVFFITHKLDFIQSEDEIIQFKDGKVLFSGKFKEWKRN